MQTSASCVHCKLSLILNIQILLQQNFYQSLMHFFFIFLIPSTYKYLFIDKENIFYNLKSKLMFSHTTQESSEFFYGSSSEILLSLYFFIVFENDIGSSDIRIINSNIINIQQVFSTKQFVPCKFLYIRLNTYFHFQIYYPVLRSASNNLTLVMIF